MKIKEIGELTVEYLGEKAKGCGVWCLSYIADDDGERVRLEKITPEEWTNRVKSVMFYKKVFNAKIRVESAGLTERTPWSLSIKCPQGVIKERYYIIKENTKDARDFERKSQADAEAMAWSLWGVRVNGGLLS